MTEVKIFIYCFFNLWPIFTDEAEEAQAAFQKELITTIDFIIEDLKRDSTDIGSIVIVVEGGELLEIIKKIAPPSWPEAVHVQSFMGYEAPVVIWLTSGNYSDRQVRKPSTQTWAHYVTHCFKESKSMKTSTVVNQQQNEYRGI